MERILRSMIFVPANSWRMITGATADAEDAVILDLEDACPLGEKETGRVFARDSLTLIKSHNIDTFVRINSFDTGLTREDLNYIVAEGLDGVMLPKAESREDMAQLDAILGEEERKKGLKPGSVSIIPLIENPKGILAATEIIAASKRVIAVSFGAGDYSREIGAGMGVTRLSLEENELLAYHPRCHIALAARAAGIMAIDSPFFGLVINTKGLIEESLKSKLIGFTGKMLTHPSHIGPVNEAFAPSSGDVDFARQVAKAYEQAKARGLGATTVGGRMIDYGSYRRASSVLARAESIAAREKLRAAAR